MRRSLFEERAKEEDRRIRFLLFFFGLLSEGLAGKLKVVGSSGSGRRLGKFCVGDVGARAREGRRRRQVQEAGRAGRSKLEAGTAELSRTFLPC